MNGIGGSVAWSLQLLLLTTSGFAVLGGCPAHFHEIEGECFFFEPKQHYNWTGAQYYCHDLGGYDRATLDSCDLMGGVIDYITQSSDASLAVNYWTGGHYGSSWAWVGGYSIAMKAPYWASSTNDPLPSDNKKGCVAMNKEDGFYYHNNHCADTYNFVCKQYSSTDCTYNNYWKIDSHCFGVWANVSLSWNQAQQWCHRYHGYLATVDNCHEFEQIIYKMTDSSTHIAPETNSVWIGGFVNEGVWQWTEGSFMSTSPFLWGNAMSTYLKPDGDDSCAAITPDSGFHLDDRNCSVSMGVICQASML